MKSIDTKDSNFVARNHRWGREIDEVWLDNSKLEGVLPSDVIIDQESYYLGAGGAD